MKASHLPHCALLLAVSSVLMLAIPFALVIGIVLPFAVLHLARGVARLQGAIAKSLLVKSAS